MNYLIAKNKTNFQKLCGDLDFEIDTLDELKSDMVSCFNQLNPQLVNAFCYHPEDNAISQNIGSDRLSLGIDYIGPSRYYAKKSGLSDLQILTFSLYTRELGGHLIFPTERYSAGNSFKSLNEIRSYRFKERIDYFLFELKQWYLGKNQVNAAKAVLDGNRKWFEQFSDFKGYIDCFCMNDFVNAEYEAYDLASCEGTRYLRVITEHPDLSYGGSYSVKLERAYIPEDYSAYIEGCTNAILQRTRRLDSIFTKL